MDLNHKRFLAEIITGLTCPYCGRPSVHADSAEVYGGRSYGMIYLCRPCNAYVGCHRSDQAKALGRLANAELRAAKSAAHAAFDPIWRSGLMERNDAYQWLSVRMGIDREVCHIGMFNEAQCQQAINICNEFKPLFDGD